MFFYSKRYLVAFFLILILLLILVYIVSVNSIPENVILFNGSELMLKTIVGIKVKQIESDSKEQTLQTSSNIEENTKMNRIKCNE